MLPIPSGLGPISALGLFGADPLAVCKMRTMYLFTALLTAKQESQIQATQALDTQSCYIPETLQKDLNIEPLGEVAPPLRWAFSEWTGEAIP